METILFKNEHLLIGNIGHIAVVVSVIAAMFSAISYAMATNAKYAGLKSFGRLFFILQSIAVLTIFITLFTIIQNHYYEYQYAYQHSSNELPSHYMISCFWEGQEGSFLLWMFWHAVLGLILMFKAKTWESPVLCIIALAQLVLGSMLLGFQFGDVKIGSSPFILMREHNPQALLIPMLEKFGKGNYLQFYKNGNGLNPLLQNYWMVIHPPTLFLGFASAIVPFAFAFAGLWTKRYKEWTIPALPWALVGVMVLGTGIIMGGYWAYESLTFGGYWAWDPVENASLMPWILLITATHLLLINKVTGKYPVLTMVITMFSFFMVLYATFLTRSGILGNSSVHSFTDLGLSGQLLILLFSFIFLSFAVSFVTLKKRILFFIASFGILLLIIFIGAKSTTLNSTLGTILLIAALVVFVYNLFKIYPLNSEFDRLYSREFWMLFGSIVLLLAGLLIIMQTSIPVMNNLFENNKASKGADYYNAWLIWFGVAIVALTGIGQFFKYRDTDSKKFWDVVVTALLIGIILSVGAVFLFNIWDFKYLPLLILSIFTIVANVHYIRTVLRGKIKIAGASIAHAGFGLMMVGVLVSSVNQKVISESKFRTEFKEEKNADGTVNKDNQEYNRENVLLAKNKPVYIADNNIVATFKGARDEGINRYFDVKYNVLKDGKIADSFTLSPNSQNNPKMGFVANPDTKHYLTKDIFTHITFESGLEQNEENKFDKYKTDTITEGKRFITKDGTRQLHLIKIENLSKDVNPNSVKLKAHISVNVAGDTFMLYPEFHIENGMKRFKEALNDQAGILLIWDNIYPQNNQMNFIITTATRRPKMDYIILKAIEFPYINLLWGGTVIMIFGFVLSIIQRFKEAKIRSKHLANAAN